MGKGPVSQNPSAILQRAVAANEMAIATTYLFTDAGQKDKFLAAQAVAMTVFAVENYFKCIIQLEKGSFLPIHKLDCLFDDMKEDSQNTIENYFNTPHPDHAVEWAEFSKLYAKPPSLHELLILLSEAFVEWRYTDFTKDLGPFRLNEVVAGARKRIREIDPKLDRFMQTRSHNHRKWLIAGGIPPFVV